MPGVPFHLTARIQGGDPFFDGIELATVRLIRTAADRSDGELMGFAIMVNHLHLLYVQGARPLSSFAGPLLTRIALLIRRTRGREGHVFERRYFESPCTNPRYLRTSIAYLHLNPVRAGICDSPAAYEWTSHASVVAMTEQNALGPCGRGFLNAMKMFSPFPGATLEQCRATYWKYVEWRLRMDFYKRSGADARGEPAPVPPIMEGGDWHWEQKFGLAALHGRERRRVRRPLPDLRDMVLGELKERDPEMPLEVIRSGRHSRSIVRVRDQIILNALELGYKGRAIANFFNISPPTVSRLKSRLLA